MSPHLLIIYSIPIILLVWSLFLPIQLALLIRGLVSLVVGIVAVVVGFIMTFISGLYLSAGSSSLERAASLGNFALILLIPTSGIGLIVLSLWFIKKSITFNKSASPFGRQGR